MTDLSPNALPQAASSAMPPWLVSQLRLLRQQPGHALLLQGPSGLGQYRLALELARASLCENPGPDGACMACTSCHAIEVRTHADLCVLMPETELMAREWPLGEKAQAELDEKKRKPSREIRVDAMREAIEFSQRTSGRGRGKVVLIYPADQMNGVTANALLKTLEEPPGDVRFFLATESAHQLLPTIRSRCISHAMAWPAPEVARQWLVGQGVAVDQVDTLLAAAGGRPEDALALLQAGHSAAQWNDFPLAMARGDAGFVKDWAIGPLLDALQKLCHDALARQQGASPRFFSDKALAPTQKAGLRQLSEWSVSLRATHRTVEHPFQPGLFQEALVEQAKTALHSAR